MKKALLFAMLVAACGVLSAQAGEPFKVSEFTFKCPEGWQQKERTSPMRAAELVVPAKDGAEGTEVTFYYFGAGQGGDAKANVARWLGQFVEPRDADNSKESSTVVGGVKVTYVEAEGTFLSGPPFGAKTPKPDYGMLGAIVEGSQGNVFVKMTGPKAQTAAASGAFKEMVEGGLKQ